MLLNKGAMQQQAHMEKLEHASGGSTYRRKECAGILAPGGSRQALRRRRDEAGVSLVEVVIAVVLLAIVSVGAIQAMVLMNRKAAATRVMTTAKEVVQRNVEVAMTAPFTATNVPAILGTTSSSGVIWDDDGGAANTVALLTSRDGANVLVSGTLRRIVVAEPNALSADIRRVTFRINYTLFNRAMSYEIATIRAQDR